MTTKDERKVECRQNMAGGEGHVLIERLLNEEQMDGKSRMYAKVTLEAGCSLGYHEHHGESETYYILSGRGIYNDNGREYEVKEGDCTFTGDGCGHGLVNDGKEDLVFMALILVG